MKMRIILKAFLLLTLFHTGFAQTDLTLPFMENVAKSAYFNPSEIHEYKVSVGLPGLSSVYFGVANTGFGFKDLFAKKSSDTLQFRSNKDIVKGLNKNNYLFVGSTIDLIYVAVKAKRWYLSFNITDNVDFRFSYPKDFMEFIAVGSGGFEGKKSDWRLMGTDIMYYREYGVGATREFKHWDIGGRVKYLSGFGNLSTRARGFGVEVGQDHYAWKTSADASLNTSYSTAFNSLLDNPDGGATVNATNLALHGRNPGAAIDGGITYKYNDKWHFSGAFNNIGFVRWKDNVTNHNIKQGYEFSGFNALRDLLYWDTDASNYVDTVVSHQVDSLKNSAKYTETHNAYTTWLVPRFYFTGKFNMTKNTHIGLSCYLDYYKSVKPSFTLGVYQKVGRAFNVVGTYSVQYRKYNLLGLGLMVKAGPVQYYMVADNVLAPLFVAKFTNSESGSSTMIPYNVKSANFRFGINLVFGANKYEDAQPFNVKEKKNFKKWLRDLYHDI